MKEKLLIIVTFFTFSMLICQTASAGIYRHDVTAEKFIALAKEPQFDCVGQLKMGEKDVGSAVLISPRWALTSAHIFADSGEAKEMSLVIGGKTFQIAKVVIHPDFKNADTGLYTDLAMIKLTGEYSGKTAKIYQRETKIGSIVTIVGYGRFRGAFEKEAIGGGKRPGQNVIDTIGGEKLPVNFLGMDLTDPRNPVTDKSGNKSPLELEYILEGGDSGGGAFIEINGEWFLTGINTRSNYNREKLMKFEDFGFYGTKSYLTGIFAYQKWITLNLNDSN